VKRSDRIVLAALLVCGVVAFVGTFWIQQGPGGGGSDVGSRFTPQLFSGALIVFCGLALFFGGSDDEHHSPFDRTLVMIVLLAIAYSVALPVLGYVVSTFATLLGALLIVRADAWWRVTLFSAVTTGILYFIFERIMLVGLPTGTWRL
jgi:ABC-type Mn2+/Zn2+ transport system permease subunit